jgi:hypothetical protein
MLVTVNLDSDIGLTTTTSVPVESLTGPIDLLCADHWVLMRAQGSSRALIGHDGANVQALDLDGRVPLVLTDEYLYASDGLSSVMRRPLMADNSWEDFYEGSKARIVGMFVSDTDSLATIVQASSSGATEVVSLAGDRTVIRRSPSVNPSWTDASPWSLWQDVLVSVGRRDNRTWVFVENLPSQATPVSSASIPDTLTADAGTRAMAWLERQLGAPFRTRDGREGRLIDSYEDADSRGWTYDAALAAIVFTSYGQIDRARQLLNGLGHLQNDDGSWEFAYDVNRAEPINGPRYVGAIAWVVMAANFFQWETGDATFDPMADRALRFIEMFIVKDPASPLAGAVSMGPASPRTISTENSIDAMSAFLWHGRLAGRTADVETSERLRDFVWERLGNQAPSMPFLFKVGATDSSLYLDAQSWTTLALGTPDAPDARLASALARAEEKLRVDHGSIAALTDIVGFRDSETASPLKVWSEGTEGMVAAYLWLGDVDDARAYHEQTARLQTASGGIPYATDSPDGWSTRPSVAGTAWFLLNRLWPPRNPFAPDSSLWLKAFGDRPHMVR